MKDKIIRELFESGYDFNVFKGESGNPNYEKINKVLDNAIIDDELINRLENQENEVKILSFGENWCPDCVMNETILHKMIDKNSKIKIKYLPREGNEELISSFDTEGKSRIPLIIFMDKEYKIKGTFNEVPKIVSEITKNGTQVDIIVIKRKYRNGELVKDIVNEFIELIER